MSKPLSPVNQTPRSMKGEGGVGAHPLAVSQTKQQGMSKEEEEEIMKEVVGYLAFYK